MMFYEERNPKFSLVIFKFSAGLLIKISCLPQILSVCSRLQAERSRKNMIKMAVNQQEILLSELRVIFDNFYNKN